MKVENTARERERGVPHLGLWTNYEGARSGKIPKNTSFLLRLKEFLLSWYLPETVSFGNTFNIYIYIYIYI
jgi:hypothetical protein